MADVMVKTGAAEFISGWIAAGLTQRHAPFKVSRLETSASGTALKLTLASGVVVHVLVTEDRALETE
jgi:hypothetical protein